MQRSDKNRVLPICFYGDVINKAKILKSDTSKLVKSLKNHISKGCCLKEIVLAKI